MPDLILPVGAVSEVSPRRAGRVRPGIGADTKGREQALDVVRVAGRAGGLISATHERFEAVTACSALVFVERHSSSVRSGQDRDTHITARGKSLKIQAKSANCHLIGALIPGLELSYNRMVGRCPTEVR